MTGAEHKGVGRVDFTDNTLIYQFSAGLNSGAQKCIGSTSGTQPLFLRQLKNRQALFPVQGEGFFTIGMFSIIECHCINTGMILRCGQIQNNINIFIPKKFFSAEYGNSVFTAPLFCS